MSAWRADTVNGVFLVGTSWRGGQVWRRDDGWAANAYDGFYGLRWRQLADEPTAKRIVIDWLRARP